MTATPSRRNRKPVQLYAPDAPPPAPERLAPGSGVLDLEVNTSPLTFIGKLPQVKRRSARRSIPTDFYVAGLDDLLATTARTKPIAPPRAPSPPKQKSKASSPRGTKPVAPKKPTPLAIDDMVIQMEKLADKATKSKEKKDTEAKRPVAKEKAKVPVKAKTSMAKHEKPSPASSKQNPVVSSPKPRKQHLASPMVSTPLSDFMPSAMSPSVLAMEASMPSTGKKHRKRKTSPAASLRKKSRLFESPSVLLCVGRADKKDGSDSQRKRATSAQAAAAAHKSTKKLERGCGSGVQQHKGDATKKVAKKQERGGQSGQARANDLNPIVAKENGVMLPKKSNRALAMNYQDGQIRSLLGVDMGDTNLKTKRAMKCREKSEKKNRKTRPVNETEGGNAGIRDKQGVRKKRNGFKNKIGKLVRSAPIAKKKKRIRKGISDDSADSEGSDWASVEQDHDLVYDLDEDDHHLGERESSLNQSEPLGSSAANMTSETGKHTNQRRRKKKAPARSTSVTKDVGQLQRKARGQGRGRRSVMKDCGKCIVCREAVNCGRCVPCLNMTDFGGDGTLGAKCRLRVCITPVFREAVAVQLTGAHNKDSDDDRVAEDSGSPVLHASGNHDPSMARSTFEVSYDSGVESLSDNSLAVDDMSDLELEAEYACHPFAETTMSPLSLMDDSARMRCGISDKSSEAAEAYRGQAQESTKFSSNSNSTAAIGAAVLVDSRKDAHSPSIHGIDCGTKQSGSERFSIIKQDTARVCNEDTPAQLAGNDASGGIQSLCGENICTTTSERSESCKGEASPTKEIAAEMARKLIRHERLQYLDDDASYNSYDDDDLMVPPPFPVEHDRRLARE